MTDVVRVGATRRIPLHLQLLADREAFRRRLRGREDLVDDVTEVLFEHNPVGLPGGNRSEYRAEAETIVASLDRHTTLPEMLNIVHSEFVNWFDADLAGPPARYTQAATQIWRATRHHLNLASKGPGLPGSEVSASLG